MIYASYAGCHVFEDLSQRRKDAELQFKIFSAFFASPEFVGKSVSAI
jgi:hypothetical protein